MGRSIRNAVKAEGSRAEVWHGTARHTSGGLEKKDLMMNRHGRIVSIARYNIGLTQMENMMNSKHANKFKSNQDKVRSRKL
jgi:hypothetical protein